MTEYDERYTRYQLDRGRLRKLVRRFYLDSAARKLHGPTVDFGCGVGELLRRLPAGSMGLEINPATVQYCRANGLDAVAYDADQDDWSLGVIGPERGMQSLVVSHVLEHLHQPLEKLGWLLRACERLRIERVLVVVPGRKGYQSDGTHRTFVDLRMLSDPGLIAGTDFILTGSRYFPGNLRALGDVFPHHELQVTFDNAALTPAQK